MRLYNEFAQIYDDVSKGLEGELEFYLKEARKSKGPILEAGCGTGRILLPLLREGLDIEGFDISPKMLKVLGGKARQEGLKPQVWRADMRDFRSKRRYGLIIVPYRAFNHCESSEGQIKALRCLRKHLKRGGRIIMNFFYPSFSYMARMDGRRSVRSPISYKGAHHLVQEEVRFEPIEQILTSHWILRDTHGKTKKVLRTHMAYIYKKEFELLLRLSGFKAWKVYGGFKGQKLKSEREEMVWLISK